ncbi:MAG: TonB-dependent receptor plug domain-containing protein [Nitrospiria bacterium]
MRLILGLLFVFLSLGREVLGEQEPPKVLDPLVVSASHLPATIETASAGITVIEREEIEARQAVSVVDLLRQVPGLHIDQPGGRGGIASVYVRGADPNFTVILIDGVKVNDPTNSRGGSFDMSTLSPAGIERIEIVRGPLSSVYGSDAMGGVIHITTRSGTARPQTVIDLGGGAGDFYRAGVETRGPLGSADYALNLSYVDDGGVVEGNRFVGKQIGGKLSLAPSHTSWLELSLHWSGSRSESFPDDSGGPVFAVLSELDERKAEMFTAGFSFGQDLNASWEYTLNAAHYHRQEEIDSPGVAPGLRDPFGIPPNRSDNHFDRSHLSVDTLFSPSASLHFGLGVEAQLEKGESEGFLFLDGPLPNRFEQDRAVYSAYLETEMIPVMGARLQGSVRVDDPERFDPEITPRLGFMYAVVSSGTTFKADWGEGFKLPSFFALGNAIVGNPSLLPETAKSLEIGIEQMLSLEGIQVSAVYFHNRYENLIDLAEGPPPSLVNRSEVTGQGLEVELSFKSTPDLWLNTHLTYTHMDIEGSREELRNRPEWRGGLNTYWRPKASLSTNLSILYVGESVDSSIATGDRDLDAHLRVDLAAHWTPTAQWKWSVVLDNLFDADYEEAVGVPAPGIRGRIFVRFRR